MQYRNTRTGALINTACAVSGGDWEEVKPAPASAAPAQEKKPAKKKSPAKRTGK